MSIWDWEFFESEITSESFSIVETGPLHEPITNFKLARDKNLNLILETFSGGDSTSKFVVPRAGEVYISSERVELTSVFGARATLSGVIPLRHNVSHSRMGGVSVSIEGSQVESVMWQRLDAPEPHYLIEWIGNLASPFLWPDSTVVTESGERVFKLASSTKEVRISSPIDAYDSRRSCVHLNVGGVELILGKSRAKPDYIDAPGFIMYKSLPNEETRKMIRDCLSFCLGDFLLYIGYTMYDEKWHPVAFNAKRGQALVEDVQRLRGHQPAPLGRRYDFEIDAALLSEMASCLVSVYGKYQLRSSFWSYWHAIAAPVHMAAAHFGACIEGLQSRFFKHTDSGIHTKLVEDEGIWEELSQKISACIAVAELPNEVRKILTNKAIHLNSAPQKVVMERFLSALELKVGKLELDVWSNRNRAAHGSTSTENPGQLIRENKVLRVLMNRILTALSDAHVSYYDYYNYGRLTVPLADPIPDDGLRKPR